MKKRSLIIGILLGLAVAIGNSVVITVISSSEDTASSVLLDSVLLPFVYQKSVINYFIDVIPSGNMYLDKRNGTIVCRDGEVQCFKNLLQYCAIREYSYEIAHEFVRCVQTRKADSTRIYGLCKRFGTFYYKEIDKCLAKRDEMLLELFQLGKQHMAKKVSAIPQLLYGKQFISLEKLLTDQQIIYDRLKNRICNLGDNVRVLKKPCNENYNILVDPIFIQQQEQYVRNSRSTQRLIKYTGDVYTMRTLNLFASSLTQNDVDLSIIFDVTSKAIHSYLPEIEKLPPHFVDLHILPVGHIDLNVPCTEESCYLYKALLCGYSGSDESVLSSYSICLLKLDYLTEDSIRQCALANDLFPPSVISCMNFPSLMALFQGNVTRHIQWVAQESVMMDLASREEMDEDMLLEAEADNEDFVMSDSGSLSLDLNTTSLLPVSIFVNAKKVVFGETSMFDFLCASMKTPSSFCRGSPLVSAKYKPQTPLQEPRFDIYVNVMCKRNVAALDPLMNWIQAYPSLSQKVLIAMHPFVDVLIDKNEGGEFEFRTPHDHNHIAKAFISSCVIRMFHNPQIYWPFVKCMIETDGLATPVANQCIRETGIKVEDLQYCLTNEAFIEQLWVERREEWRKDFWATVSPYFYVNGDHKIRFETVVKLICNLVTSDEPACSHMPPLEQSIPHCMITAIY